MMLVPYWNATTLVNVEQFATQDARELVLGLAVVTIREGVMLALGRAVSAFTAMMVVGYLAMVALVPAPAPASLRDADEDAGQNAAVRLSAEARALVNRKPASTLQ